MDSNELNKPFKCLCNNDNFSGQYCEIDRCKQTGDCLIDNNQIELTPSINFYYPTATFVPNEKETTPSTSTSSSFNLKTPTFPTSIYSTAIDSSIKLPESYESTSTPAFQSFNAPYFNVTEKKKEGNRPSLSPNFEHANGPIDGNHHLSPKTKRIFSAKFNGSSLLQFEKDKHEFPASFTVHFDFNTNERDGILLHVEAELNPFLFAVIYLEDGLLKLSFSCNQQNTIYLISDEHHQLNKNQANHVQMHFRLDLKRGICESQIQLNNSLSINKNQTTAFQLNNKACFKYFNFGDRLGDNPFIPNHIPAFKGCLKNIHINNNLKLVQNALRANSLEECNLDRMCELKPCGQHGDCRIAKKPHKKEDTFSNDNLTTSIRFKRAFFQNSNSNNYNIQFSSAIQNNEFSSSSNDNDWSCNCSLGYFGTFCELASCEKNPCANQAICLLASNSELNCICPESKFGDYCDLGMYTLKYRLTLKIKKHSSFKTRF